MFSWLKSIFSAAIGQAFGYLMVALVAGGLLTGAYFYWQYEERQISTLQYQIAQYQLQAKNDQNEIATLKLLNTDSLSVVTTLNTKNQTLAQTLSTLNSYLKSVQATNDSRNSSTVLKNTIQQLDQINK